MRHGCSRSPVYLFTEELALPISSQFVEKTGGLNLDDLKGLRLLEAVTRPGELRTWLQNLKPPKSLAKQAVRFPHFYAALGAMRAGRAASLCRGSR